MVDLKNLLQRLERFKVPLLILLAGVALMLLPTSGEKGSTPEDPAGALAELLSCTRGVGQARVLISENGVVVVCAGASNAGVRLDIIHAVSSYTGFGSDKITILKLSN